MAELRTPGERTGGDPPFDPPRGDEGLDDWFARRLEAQGIKAGRARIPIARILALVALVGALGALGWVLARSLEQDDRHADDEQHADRARKREHDDTTTAGKKATKPTWQKIPLTVLNGFGGTNAAGTAKAQLVKAGWHVVGVADASPVTKATIVVYVPGKLAWAQIVARRLGLPAPVPIAQAAGVVSTQTDSVAIVLGSDLLPNGAGATA